MIATRKALRRTIEMTLQRMADVVGRLTRGMTLGVRALVIGPDGRIFLVKHSYVGGWHLPGGGVEPGETLIDALVRELREEGNLEPTAPPVLHGMFFNDSLSPRNHVAVFVVRDFRQLGRAGAGLRDHRARILRSRRAAERHHGGDARAHHRGRRRSAGQRALVGASAAPGARPPCAPGDGPRVDQC